MVIELVEKGQKMMSIYPGEWWVGLTLIFWMGILVLMTVIWGRRNW